MSNEKLFDLLYRVPNPHFNSHFGSSPDADDTHPLSQAKREFERGQGAPAPATDEAAPDDEK